MMINLSRVRVRCTVGEEERPTSRESRVAQALGLDDNSFRLLCLRYPRLLNCDDGVIEENVTALSAILGMPLHDNDDRGFQSRMKTHVMSCALTDFPPRTAEVSSPPRKKPSRRRPTIAQMIKYHPQLLTLDVRTRAKQVVEQAAQDLELEAADRAAFFSRCPSLLHCSSDRVTVMINALVDATDIPPSGVKRLLRAKPDLVMHKTQSLVAKVEFYQAAVPCISDVRPSGFLCSNPAVLTFSIPSRVAPRLAFARALQLPRPQVFCAPLLLWLD